MTAIGLAGTEFALVAPQFTFGGRVYLAVEQDGHMVIPEKLTQKDMANRVGASREMINRILRDLTTGGYIKVESGHITIQKTPPARW